MKDEEHLKEAIANLGAIIEIADGLMVARGDLGVEIPIHQIAIKQKDLITAANLRGKPAISNAMPGKVAEESTSTVDSIGSKACAADGTSCS